MWGNLDGDRSLHPRVVPSNPNAGEASYKLEQQWEGSAMGELPGWRSNRGGKRRGELPGGDVS